MQRIHVVGVSPRTGTTLLAECMTACFAIDAFEDHEAPLMKHRSRANIYLTKNPGDIWIVRPRLLVDPRFHVIAMLRDPRDVIVSRHLLDPNRYWAPLWFWKSRASLLKQLQQQKRCVLWKGCSQYDDGYAADDRTNRTESPSSHGGAEPGLRDDGSGNTCLEWIVELQSVRY